MRKLYDEQSDVVMPHPLSMNGSYKGTTKSNVLAVIHWNQMDSNLNGKLFID